MPSARQGRKNKPRPSCKRPAAISARKRTHPPYKILIVSQGRELRKIGAKALMEFINPFIDERAYLSLQKKVTLEEERKFVEESARALDLGNAVKVFLFVDGKVAGNCDVRKSSVQGEEGNVSFGLAVSREFRGFGFGELLLRKGIAVARKKFKPHRMWIDHVGGNKIAAQLYRKVGFVEVARLKEYHLHYGKRHDKVMMEYVGRR